MSIMKKLVLYYFNFEAWRTGGQAVAVKRNDDRVFFTVAKQYPEGTMLCDLYYRAGIRPLFLMTDGSVIDARGMFDFKETWNWLPVNLEERTWMILQGARGFDF